MAREKQDQAVHLLTPITVQLIKCLEQNVPAEERSPETHRSTTRTLNFSPQITKVNKEKKQGGK